MFFSEDFFRSEERCGFEVTGLMKRAWAAQMEVLNVIIDICTRNGLQYYADWGTLLGAVRHKGFIPWDDDIDICLKREDYRKLIKILPQELPKGFYVAGIHAVDPRLVSVNKGHQLRVFAERDRWDMMEYMQYFHGYPFEYAGVDVFPLDIIPSEEGLFELQKNIVLLGFAICDILDNGQDLENRDELLEKRVGQFEELCGLPVSRENLRFHVLQMLDHVTALYREDEGDYLVEYGFLSYLQDYRIRKEWYDRVIQMPFENMEIAVPAEYDKILRMCYGDYSQFVRGNQAHDYPYYKKMEEKMSRELRHSGISLSVEAFCEKVMAGEIQVNWDFG